MTMRRSPFPGGRRCSCRLRHRQCVPQVWVRVAPPGLRCLLLRRPRVAVQPHPAHKRGLPLEWLQTRLRRLLGPALSLGIDWSWWSGLIGWLCAFSRRFRISEGSGRYLSKRRAKIRFGRNGLLKDAGSGLPSPKNSDSRLLCPDPPNIHSPCGQLIRVRYCWTIPSEK